MTNLAIAGAAVAAGTYTAFIFGYRLLFVRVGPPSPRLRLLAVCAVVSGVAQTAAIAVAEVTWSARTAVGFAMFACSVALFLATARLHAGRKLSLAYSPDVPVHLVRRGPYRFVRHPFYTSYLMSYAAGLVLSGDVRLCLVLLVMTGIYVDAAAREEGKFSNSMLAAEYADYRAVTGMFLPNPSQLLRLRPARVGSGSR